MQSLDFMLPLSQDHILAIGRVTAYFSLLENYTNTLIADLLELKSREDAVSVTAHMNYSSKIQLVKTLSSTKFDEDSELRKKLGEVINEMEISNVNRNKIVHASWYYYSPSKNESGLLKQTARGKIKTTLEGFTPDKIDDIAVSIFETTGKIQHFLQDKNGALYFG